MRRSLDWYFWTPPIFLTPIKKIMKNTDLLCEIGLKYERNMGYQNMGGGQKYQSNYQFSVLVNRVELVGLVSSSLNRHEKQFQF